MSALVTSVNNEAGIAEFAEESACTVYVYGAFTYADVA